MCLCVLSRLGVGAAQNATKKTASEVSQGTWICGVTRLAQVVERQEFGDDAKRVYTGWWPSASCLGLELLVQAQAASRLPPLIYVINFLFLVVLLDNVTTGK